jgi:hypothetical protein
VACVATVPSTEQRETIARLRLEDLADQDDLAARVGPRPGAQDALYLRPNPEPHDFKHFQTGLVKTGSEFTNY